MNRLGQAFLLGSTFVGVVALVRVALGRTALLLLLPGIVAGISVPNSGFDLETDHPLSLLAYTVMGVVNVAVYTGLSYCMLYFVRRVGIPADTPSAPPES